MNFIRFLAHKLLTINDHSNFLSGSYKNHIAAEGFS